MKKIFGLTIILFLSSMAHAQEEHFSRDCTFYNEIIKKDTLETVWTGSIQTATSEHLYVKVCDTTYDITLGCDGNSDANGNSVRRGDSLLPVSKLEELQKSIKKSVTEHTIKKQADPKGKTYYVIPCY
ncbi:MAG: hypothetical protein JWM20_728 [Patescibacteria group bacterium]|nr:hypothetical protein [Patescibacteria group bacterium]